MSFTTPELVAIRMAQLEAEAAAERLARVARVTAWAHAVGRQPTRAAGHIQPMAPGLQLRSPRL